VPRCHLRSSYAGREWLRRNLDAIHTIRSNNPRIKSPGKPPQISPLGESVADLLGLVWRGLYHLDSRAIERTDWSDERRIAVRVSGELATWDYDELTQLVVVSHDMHLRLSIAPRGKSTELLFTQREGTFSYREREGFASKMPQLDDHVIAIRSLYDVVPQPGEST